METSFGFGTVTDRPYTGEACILDSSGDTRIQWDKDNAEEVAAAKDTFDRLTKKGKYSAFSVKTDGGQGKRLSDFDPAVERLIFVPQLQGG